MQQGRTAIVTGGSRGLGRALVEALAAAGWNVVTDGRDAAALDAAVDRLGDHVVGVPGDVTDPDHRAALVDRRHATRRRRRPARQQRRRARAVAAARPRRVPARRAGRAVRRQRRRPARPDPSGAAEPRGAPGDRRRHHVGRLRRGVRRVGRLRVDEGGARPPRARPRRRAPGAARADHRSGRHAHADAPGRLPRRGHLRPAPPGGRRAGCPGADRGPGAQRAPSGRRPSSRSSRHWCTVVGDH